MATEIKTIMTDETGEKIVEALDTIANAVQNSSGGTSGGYTSLEDMTWSEIADICKAGKAAGLFHVGQEKRITVNGEEAVAVIIGFNHDELATANSSYNNGSGKAAITWFLKDCLKTTYQMNSSNTTSGGWSGCAFYSTLNTTIYNGLDSDLKDAIVTAKKYTSEGNGSSSITTSNDNLFLLSQVEIDGTYLLFYMSGTEYDNSYLGEGHQYEYFVGKAISFPVDAITSAVHSALGQAGLVDRFGNKITGMPCYTTIPAMVKGLGSDATSSCDYWLRSPSAVGSSYFCFVGGPFACVGYYYASDSYGAAFGFCT